MNSTGNQSFTGTIVCHRKFESNASQTRKVNVSHTELNPKITLKKPNNSKLMNTSKSFLKPEQSLGMKLLWEKRASGIARPKTSLGRNSSLYSNVNKYNLSCVQTKNTDAEASHKNGIEQYISNRSCSEQGNIEISVCSPTEVAEPDHHQSTQEGSSNGPKMTKNYSLNTIFERKSKSEYFHH